jgi:hypothetical protein
LCNGLPERFCKLIGAGGILETAPGTFQCIDDFFGFTADDEFADPLQVAVASACKKNGVNDVVFVDVQIDLAGTSAFCSVNHNELLPYFLKIM